METRPNFLAIWATVSCSSNLLSALDFLFSSVAIAGIVTLVSSGMLSTVGFDSL